LSVLVKAVIGPVTYTLAGFPIAVMTIAKPVLARVVATEELADIPSFARVRATD
jgi:hypothetical protein